MTAPSNDTFPRICYVGSLPVEATSAGMMLLYRLMETYPADRLHIVHLTEDGGVVSKPERRIKGVNYSTLGPLFERGWYFARMRMPRLFWIMLELHAWWQARQVAKAIAPFRPDAILTVHEQFGWITAAKLARRLGVPLHLILHDDWFRNLPMAGVLKERFERAVGETYRAAHSRLCISPYMEQAYARRFGAPGTVLYPSRARNGVRFAAPPATLGQADRPLRVAYGGNVFHRGYWDALGDLATALETVGGQLLIFGPSKEDVARFGLERPNVIAQGFVYNLLELVREQAQVLFLPMTFEPHERPNMEVSFPSKLTEYTGAGLPLLVHGPDYCSAVRWARENPDSAEVVTEPGVPGLQAALKNLQEPAHREKLARRAMELGDKFFSFETGTEIFQAAMRK